MARFLHSIALFVVDDVDDHTRESLESSPNFGNSMFFLPRLLRRVLQRIEEVQLVPNQPLSVWEELGKDMIHVEWSCHPSLSCIPFTDDNTY